MMSRFAALADHRRFALLLLAAGCVAASASSARGDTRDGFELSWKAPAGCPSEREVYARIRSLLGDASVNDSSISVEATVTRGRRGELHLELKVRSAALSGTRELDGSACDDLAGATAVNVVLLLHAADSPPAAAEASPIAASPDAPSAAAPTSVAPPTSDDIAPDSPRRWNVLLRLPLVGASFGLLPRPSASAGLQAGVQLERWTLSIGATAWLPQTLTAPSAASAEAVVVRAEAAVRGCRAMLGSFVVLAPCVGVSLQHIWARGAGARVTPQAASATWFAPGIGLQARAQLIERMAVITYLEVAWQSVRPRVVIDGLGGLEPLGAADVGFWLGTEWIL